MGSGAKAMGQRSRKIVKTVTKATPAYTATVNIKARENTTNRSAIDWARPWTHSNPWSVSSTG